MGKYVGVDARQDVRGQEMRWKWAAAVLLTEALIAAPGSQGQTPPTSTPAVPQPSTPAVPQLPLPFPNPSPAPTTRNKEIEALKAEVEALIQQRKSAIDTYNAERRQLVTQLKELLKRIEERPIAKAPAKWTTPPRKFDFSPAETPIDLIRAATNLYRDGDFDAALRTFRLVENTDMSREDKIYVKYMIANCLRRTNRITEATALYREVAENPDDPFLANCAIWHLSIIRNRQELETELQKLRERFK